MARSQLAAHPAFAEVSPAVGQLDERALGRELARDGDAAIALLADLAAATDPLLRRHARQLAGRLLPPLGRIGTPRQRGSRRLVSRTGAEEGELDLDRTFERSNGRRPHDPADLVVRQFAAAPRTLCLLVDRSGSMNGHGVALAAVAAAAVVTAASDRLRCSVIAFAAEPMVLLSLGAHRTATAVVDDLLSLRGHGRTDLAGALHVAATELDRAAPAGRTVLLLSDALYTAGDDPLGQAGRFDCLHVLGTSEDPDAVKAGHTLARRGGGRYLAATQLSRLTGALRLALA